MSISSISSRSLRIEHSICTTSARSSFAYRTGTQRVAELRRKHPPNRVLPALYGCNGLDIETIDELLPASAAADHAR